MTRTVYPPAASFPYFRPWYPGRMPGNVGWQGLLIILIILLLVFSPKRLPEMGRSIGRGMREFKDSISGTSRSRHDDEDEFPALR